MPKTKKILLIAYNFPPLISPQSLRWFYLSREMCRLGYNIDVLTIRMPSRFTDLTDLLPRKITTYNTFPGIFYYLTFKFSHEYTSKDDTKISSNISNLFWNFLSKLHYKSYNVLNLFMIPDIYAEWFPFAFKKIAELVRKNSYDIVISSSEPKICHIIGFFLKVKSNIRWIADYGDPWIYPMPIVNEPGFKRKLIENLEKIILKKIDVITVATEGIKKLYISKYPFLVEDKISVLPQGYDPEMFTRVGCEKTKKFRIVYCGSFYSKLRDPGPFLDAIKEIDINVQNDIEVLIAGRINEFADLLKKEFKEGIVKYLGVINHEHSLYLQNSAAVLLHIGNATDVQVPGKIYEYFGARRPIICIKSKNGDLSEELIVKYNRGLVVNNIKADIKKSIIELYNLWKKGILDSTFGLDAVDELTWRNRAIYLNNIINSL